MRINLRAKIKNYTIFFMLSKTQTLEGISSKVIGKEKEHLHYIFWDIENCTKEQAIETLQDVQYKYKLGDIFLVSDIKNSFRAFCFSIRTWFKYIEILVNTKHLDYNFFYWTIYRGDATMRISNKKGRKPQQIVAFIKGYEKAYIPQIFNKVIYDTGNQKRGIIKSVKI